jgi:alpha-tubulin suppressor-like RCC1 family protein
MSQELHDITDAKFGDSFLCMTRTVDHARLCWGRNEGGQLGDTGNVNTTTPAVLDAGVVGAAVGYGGHGCQVTVDGAVQCWGYNTRGECALPSSTFTVMEPTTINGPDGPLASCTRVALGKEHTCALCGGKVVCWGEDFEGATGIPDTAAADNIPTPITIDKTFVDLVSRAYGACALTSAGEIYCWGNGAFGANGDGGQARNLPTDLTTRF